MPGATIVFCLLLLTGSGCQLAPSPSKYLWPWSEKEDTTPPDRIMAVWTDTVLHQPNQPGVRGFGGRVYFYQAHESDPIEVTGGLAVYVFDADELQTRDQHPLRKFVFTADQFATHMSSTSLGPSYSIWLPWDEVGGHPMRLSLIARFEGTAGGTTISEPTIKLLPGVPNREVNTEQELAQQRSSSPFQLAGHSSQAHLQDNDTSDDPSSGNTSTHVAPKPRNIKTIDLPPSFQRHLRRAGEPETPQTDSPVQETPANDNSASVAPSPVSAAGGLSTLDAQAVQTLATSAASAPMTTQVFDHRTRTQQRFEANYPQSSPQSFTQASPPTASRINIREGRWIEGLPRTSLR